MFLLHIWICNSTPPSWPKARTKEIWDIKEARKDNNSCQSQKFYCWLNYCTCSWILISDANKIVFCMFCSQSSRLQGVEPNSTTQGEVVDRRGVLCIHASERVGLFAKTRHPFHDRELHKCMFESVVWRDREDCRPIGHVDWGMMNLAHVRFDTRSC